MSISSDFLFLLYIHCQEICLHGYSITTIHRQSKVVFTYLLLDLSSKKNTQNIYITNLTIPDYKYWYN